MMIEDILPVIVMVIGFGIVSLIGVGLYRFMKSRFKLSDIKEIKKAKLKEDIKGVVEVGENTNTRKSSEINQKPQQFIAVGIDLGTTKCCVATIIQGKPMIIPNAYGNTTTPSVVAFRGDGEVLVGEDALSQAVLNVRNTFFNVKRAMGSSQKFFVGNQTITPQQIVSHLLTAIKLNAETYLGKSVRDAVISVPASFNDAQRSFTHSAAKMAGLNALRIINEPTAAALAYGLEKKKEEKILVFDLGGGTFDVSVLEVGEGIFEVRAVNGDTHLGGINFDKRIADWLIVEFAKEYHNINLQDDDITHERLMEAAERAKIELSSVSQVEIYIPYIARIGEQVIDFKVEITRAKFEQLTADLTERCKEPLEKALEESGFKTADLDEVILVGGATRMPVIQKLVKDYTGKEPHKGVNPDEVVAVGAAIQAGVLEGDVRDVVLLDVIPVSLGIEAFGGVMTRLIEKNTTTPTQWSEIFTTAANNQTSVDIHVLQGERDMARDNKTIGRLKLDGIPPAPKGIPQIKVTFDIDTNGIVNVSAKDTATGREVNARIEDRGSLIEPIPGSVCPYGRWIGDRLTR